MRPGSALRNRRRSVAAFEYVQHDMGVVLTVRSSCTVPRWTRGRWCSCRSKSCGTLVDGPGPWWPLPSRAGPSRGAGRRAAGPGPAVPGLILQMARGAKAAARTSLGVVRRKSRPRPDRSLEARAKVLAPADVEVRAAGPVLAERGQLLARVPSPFNQRAALDEAGQDAGTLRVEPRLDVPPLPPLNSGLDDPTNVRVGGLVVRCVLLMCAGDPQGRTRRPARDGKRLVGGNNNDNEDSSTDSRDERPNPSSGVARASGRS
jgi:hypothetical protein